MSNYLTIHDAMKKYQLCYTTVYKNKANWGFFQLEGTRKWLVDEKELELKRKTNNNTHRLAPVVKEKKCQFTKEGKSIGLISPPQIQKELDVLLAHRINAKRKSITTS